MWPARYLLFKIILGFLPFSLCTAIRTITPEQPLNDGDILVSRNETFAVGFFSPANSDRRYIGIWFNKISERTVVWVANRDDPFSGPSGVLSIGLDGNLRISSDNYSFQISDINISKPLRTTNYKARLLDSGNLQLLSQVDDGSVSVQWQSFDHPTNHHLPGMKIGLDWRTGLNRVLRSWKSRDDPGTGEYSYGMDLRGLHQQGLYKDSTLLWRNYPRQSKNWRGNPEFAPIIIVNFTYIDDRTEVSAVYTQIDLSVPLTTYLDESGYLRTVTWVDGKWVHFFTLPSTQCDHYGQCGLFGFCDAYVNGFDFECTCLPGYEPSLEKQWYLRDASSGCKKQRPRLSMCGNGEGFVVLKGVVAPDTSSGARLEMNLGLGGCKMKCLKDCSCKGFVIGNIGECITWHGNITDAKKYPNGGLDLYVRVDSVELAQRLKKSENFLQRERIVIIVTSVLGTIFLIMAISGLVLNKRRGFAIVKSTEENIDLPIFDMVTLQDATNNFSERNVIGEGGFGTVYKGQLSSGKDIAVKRLSVVSSQGLNEFMNEVIFISRLQHRNLVKLLGCCVHGGERMLVYEYMPNGSLDSVIFGKDIRSRLLTWRRRLDIILGISRGILYLHQDSRLTVIHRDLKASNVLLDSEMNPKISDFGLARAFGGDQLYEKTRNVVGTYGYMSPEYAIDGIFSTKSDMFSFGVMVLEIISGERNRMFHHTEHDLNLLGHAWKLWKEGRGEELLDPLVEGSVPVGEVLRCIQVGLLCVQKCPDDRPTISSAVLMLITQAGPLPLPTQPGFYMERSSRSERTSSSNNYVSITSIVPR